MKTFNEIMLTESEGSDQAKKLGLTHVSFGRYADKSGKIVAVIKDGKLYKIKGDHEDNKDGDHKEAEKSNSEYNKEQKKKIGKGSNLNIDANSSSSEELLKNKEFMSHVEKAADKEGIDTNYVKEMMKIHPNYFTQEINSELETRMDRRRHLTLLNHLKEKGVLSW